MVEHLLSKFDTLRREKFLKDIYDHLDFNAEEATYEGMLEKTKEHVLRSSHNDREFLYNSVLTRIRVDQEERDATALSRVRLEAFSEWLRDEAIQRPQN